MRKLLSISILLAALLGSIGPASTQMTTMGAGRAGPYIPRGCSQATTFLARTSGLDGTHTTAYTNLICGLVTDGIWSKLDALWICATQDMATCRLNLVSTSYSLVDVSTAPTFVADRGFTAPSGGIQNTQFNPNVAGGNFAANSAHFMAWPNQTTSSNAGDMGTFAGGGGYVFLFTSPSGTNWQAELNGQANNNLSSAATGQGFYLVSRQNSAGYDWYYNNSASGNNVIATVSITASNIYVGGVNGNGHGGKQMSAASVGGALTATDAGNFYARLRTYMTAVGN